MKEKILIIGSEGFIGSYLVSFLNDNGYEVVSSDVVDKSKNNYIKLDSSNTDFNSLFEGNSPSYCINCSGAASVPLSFEMPLNDFVLNVLNVMKILEAIRLYAPCCKFINFSSAAIYGNPENIPIMETFNKNPISPYGFHKSMVENVLEEYNKCFNIKTCTLRLFSAYGSGLKKQIMFDLYKKFESDEIVSLYGTGNETRDYIHVKDICRAVEIVMKNSTFDNDIINVANGKEISLKTVVKIYQKYMKSDKKIVFSGNVRTGDPMRWKADISKLSSWGYRETIDMETGIEEYVQWVKSE